MKRYVIQKGKKIPMMAVYHVGGRGGRKTTYEPQYVLISKEEALKRENETRKLNKSLGHTYEPGTEKCCGVHPMFETELRNGGDSYYVCRVCGKEGVHCSMEHLSRKAWNDRYFTWVPVGHQYTVLELFHDVEELQKED